MHDLDPLTAVTAERLRALPEESVAPYGWQEFRRRASTAARGARRDATSSALAFRAAAAMLLVSGATAFAGWMWGQSATSANRTARAVQADPVSAARVAGTEPAHRSVGIDARARAMELWIARQPAHPAMVRVGSYAAVAGLEDRIAQLDDLLTTARAEGAPSANLSPLETQRARLVTSLAQVRYAELVAESPP